MPIATSEILERARFQPEVEMRKRLVERFGLAEASNHIPEDARARSERSLREIRASMTHLTRGMASGLIRLIEETLERLGLEPQVELLINPMKEINAYTYGILGDSGKHLIILTAGIVKQLTDEQLRCVLGHEIGHNAYGHAQLDEDIRLIYRDGDGVPELLKSRLYVLDRLEEFSADRAGLVAVNNNVTTAASMLLHIHTGLGPKDIHLDLDAFTDEIARLEAFDIPDRIGRESHPLLPLRIRALQIFAANQDDEEGVMELARMMDFEARDEAVVHRRNLLLAGGLLAAHADSDDELADDEREHLVELILPFSDDPEELLDSVGTIDRASDLFTASATWIRKNAGPERYDFMDELISVVLCDDKVHEGEVRFLKQAATKLKIPFSWVEKKLEGHSERAARKKGAPRVFGLRK